MQGYETTGTELVGVVGIGAGPGCDGQVQVFHDLMGLDEDFLPRHAKQYTELANQIRAASTRYLEEVQDGTFPAEEHSVDFEKLMGQSSGSEGGAKGE